MKIGIIGGTALEQLVLTNPTETTVKTPWGEPSGIVHRGSIGAAEVYFLNRHGDDHRIPPHAINYKANIAALHQLGVDGIIAVSAVGGITPAMTTGALVLPHQLIDYTWGRAHSYSESAADPLLHVDFTHPYCEKMRAKLATAAQSEAIELILGAVYAVAQGPRLETAAEINRMERDGCDLVGMTAMPEAALARELAIPYVALALVVNPAAGKSAKEITMADIAEVMAAATPKILTLLTAFCTLGN